MKVPVFEIDKNELLGIYNNYLSVNEIAVLENIPEKDLENEELKSFVIDERYDVCRIKPYWINENIADLENLIRVCVNKLIYNYNQYADSLSNFVDFLLNVYKQRQIGYKISDIRYIYEVCKETHKLEFINSDELEGWQSNYKVIVGESKLGKMYLYKDGDFVFCVEYQTKGLLGKMKTKNTHWHPQFYTQAIEYLNDFMNDSLEIR